MKTIIITQARMGSTRLPGKVLLKIKDRTIIDYHLQRLKFAGVPIIVATTNDKVDDDIASFCGTIKMPCFRGNSKDVLDRYYRCAIDNKCDTIVRVTSDCPLIDGGLIKEALGVFEAEPVDYLSNTLVRTYPRGFDFEILSMKAFEIAFLNAKDKSEREHVTSYIWKNKVDKFRLLNYSCTENKPDYRITLDCEDDLLVIRELIEKYQADKKGYKEIISILNNNPYISELNSKIIQKEYGE